METFVEEMKRYLGLTPEDISLLRQLGPRLEKYFPEMAERFYSQIPHHPNAFQVFTGGQAQIARLKSTLQDWAHGVFGGVYDEAYARERFQIGYRHVRIGLEQKYVISAMGIVRAFLHDCLLVELPTAGERRRFAGALHKILTLDLNLMCESYMHATLENLRKLNEQLEAANRELAQASRTKDEFLSHISHELRTPLNSILGFTKMILDGLSGTREEEQELLRDVFGSAQHLLALVNDILDLRRVEEGKMSLRIENVDLRRLLDSTLPLVALQAAEKGLRLRNETAAAALPVVWADEMRLRQVLLNLLNNAVKFTPEGSITIRAQTDEAVPGGLDDRPPRLVRLEIEDTGIGIPAEKRDSAFEEFVQLDQIESRKFRGAGLGLAISRRLVELMGGRIGLESGSSGRGTLAWLTVPVAETVAPKEPVAASRA
jgi:signal transduction histidine kinase